MDEILKKIDEEIAEVRNSNGYITLDKPSVLFGMEKIKEIILSKEPHEQWVERASDNTNYVLAYANGLYCVTDSNGSVVCEFIHDVTPKVLTLGDKIREDNESLAEFIIKQFGDSRVFMHENEIYMEDYLNQPYTEWQ